MSYKGKFHPQHPEKYFGNLDKIIYRSLWERKCMDFFDRNTDILQWGSEPVGIQYYSPLQNKWRKYFPDFYVKRRLEDGIIEQLMIEIKPLKQTLEPKKPLTKKGNKKYINERFLWSINSAKWKAAEEWCNKRKIKFIKLTEKDLGL